MAQANCSSCSSLFSYDNIDVSLYAIALVDMLNPLNPDSLGCGRWSLLADHWFLMPVLKLAVDVTLYWLAVVLSLCWPLKWFGCWAEISPQTF